MPYQYNPTGANNGMFAPAYVAGNPLSQAAVAAWNAKNTTPRPADMVSPIPSPVNDTRNAIAQMIMARRIGGARAGGYGGFTPTNVQSGLTAIGNALGSRYMPNPTSPFVQPAGTDSSGGPFTFRDIPGPVGTALNSPVMQPYLNAIRSGFQQSPATAVAQQVGGRIFGGR